MLTFFRKIRKGLLGSGQARKPALSPVPSGTEGKVERYLFYAVGEILLVMLGILLALQVNNWNEWRKERVRESLILKEMKETLQKNCDNLSDELNVLIHRNEQANTLLIILSENLPYDKSVERMIHLARIGTRFSLSYSGYEELKNAGYNTLSSDSLKSEIIDLFEFTYPEMQKIISEVKVTPDEFSNYEFLHFEDVGEDAILLKPVDYSFILNDHYFHSMVKVMTRRRKYHMDLINESLTRSTKVLQLIKEELGVE
jgi:hypothetical protein